MKTTESYDIIFLDTYTNAKGKTMYKYQLQGDDFTSYKISQGSYYREFQGKPLYFSKYNLGDKYSIHHSLPRGFSREEYIGSYWPNKFWCSHCNSRVNLEFGEVIDGKVTIACANCDPVEYWEAYYKNNH